jgi:hypothetical protein
MQTTVDTPSPRSSWLSTLTGIGVILAVLWAFGWALTKAKKTVEELYPFDDKHTHSGKWSYAFKGKIFARLAMAAVPYGVFWGVAGWYAVMATNVNFALARSSNGDVPVGAIVIAYILVLAWFKVRQCAVWHIFRVAAHRYAKDIVPETDEDARMLGFNGLAGHAERAAQCTFAPKDDVRPDDGHQPNYVTG